MCSIRGFDFIVIHESVRMSVAAVASHFGMQEVVCVVMYSLQVGKNQSEERRSLHERNHAHGIQRPIEQMNPINHSSSTSKWAR